VIELPDADLRGADLPRADLDEAMLVGARLDLANLAGASLTYARLMGASLSEADLSAADLTGADLRQANLEGVRLDGASLADADLCGAMLAGAQGRPASIAGAKLDLAACERSELADDHVIELWHEGVDLVDIDRFSARVREACRTTPVAQGGVPSLRDLGLIDLEARRQLSDVKRRTTSGQIHALSLKRLDFASNPPPDSGPPPPSLPPPSERLRSISGQFAHLFLPEETRRPESGPAPDSQPPPAIAPGDTILEAEVESLIGRGNLGEVWKARRSGEPVAVKLFNRQKLDQGLSVAAFRRGVDTLKRLGEDGGSPQVLRVHAIAENGLAVVTDLAENGNIESFSALGWDATKTVKLFRKICDGVAVAHERGFLHRALKPSNILLDGDLEPIIADFDMVDYVTLLDGSPTAGGYVHYAAPEEMLGSGTRSPTADIFCLGRILWFLLTGTDPTEPTTQIARGNNLGDHPKGLVRIIRKCTMPEPYHRYPLVSDLLEDLDRWEDGDVGVESIAAPPMSLRPVPVSSLPQQAPWIPRRGTKEPAEKSAAASSSVRRIELGAAAIASLVMVASLARLGLQPVPSAGLVDQTHLSMAIAAPFLALWFPRRLFGEPRLARAAIAVVALGLFFFAHPAPLAAVRLRHTLSSEDGAVRVAAAKQLILLGKRDLRGVDLRYADLTGGDLGAADLRGADLRGAVLRGAALMETELTGAQLDEADLSGADLTQARVSIQEIGGASCDEVTMLPPGLRCDDGQVVEGPGAPARSSAADSSVVF
jgi:uncharacterized protein YjbI with pentapeptide repeats/tRNA A-37 threonylcarbamoyl transferase component Bud32